MVNKRKSFYQSTIEFAKEQIALLQDLKDKLVFLDELMAQETADYNAIMQAYNRDYERSQYVYHPPRPEMVREAQNILRDQAIIAMAQSPEFNQPIFKERLLQAIEDPDCIEIYGYGKSTSITIRLNRTAGSLEDYAIGVKLYRAVLEGLKVAAKVSAGNRGGVAGGIKQFDKKKASQIFFEKYLRPALYGTVAKRFRYTTKADLFDESFGTGPKTRRIREVINVAEQNIKKYKATIKGRLDLSGKLAPFWEILDKGSAQMVSTTGDTYHSTPATKFVSLAQRQIDDYLDSFKVSTPYYPYDDLDRIKAALDDLKTFRDDLSRETNLETVRKKLAARLPEIVAQKNMIGVEADRIEKLASKFVAKYKANPTAKSDAFPRLSQGGRRVRIVREFKKILRSMETNP